MGRLRHRERERIGKRLVPDAFVSVLPLIHSFCGRTARLPYVVARLFMYWSLPTARFSMLECALLKPRLGGSRG